MEQDPLDFGHWVWRRRDNVLKLSREELASIAGYSAYMIQKIEAGERGVGHKRVEGLAEALQIPRGTVTYDQFLAAARTAAREPRSVVGLPPPESIPAQIYPRPPRDSTLNESDIQIGSNPYKALEAFGLEDAPNFFGRKALTQLLIERLAESGWGSHFLAVVGPSGSGKSSVVKAGLLPALAQGALPGSQHWPPAIILKPGIDPFDALAAALQSQFGITQSNIAQRLAQDPHALRHLAEELLPNDPSCELVIVIDQFEEIFTLVEDEHYRSLVLNSLYVTATKSDSRVRIVITLRADFYDRPLLYSDFSELFRQRKEEVLPLKSDELEQAIVEPAKHANAKWEPGLVTLIMSDMKDQPSILPLLQYALSVLFERRKGRTLTRDAYISSGGVLGTLPQRADEIYADLSTPEQAAIRQLFLRLVTINDSSSDTRRRVRRTELLSLSDDADMMDDLIELYGKARLLTFDRDVQEMPTVEIAHETLIRNWGSFRRWLEASRNALRVQQRLAIEVSAWLDSHRSRDLLSTGERLEPFVSLANNAALPLSVDEHAYISASREADNIEQARRANELRTAKRATRRLIALVAVLIIGVLLLSSLSVFALNQQAQAVSSAATASSLANIDATARVNAENQALITKGHVLSAQALATFDSTPQRALLQAVGSIAVARKTGTFRVSEAVALLRQILAGTGGVPVLSQSAPISVVAFSPKGSTFATESIDGVTQLWDAMQPQAARVTLPPATASITPGLLAFSPNGNWLAAAGLDNRITLWDVSKPQATRFHLQGHTALIRSLVFSPDSRLLVTGSNDGTTRLWDLTATNPTNQSGMILNLQTDDCQQWHDPAPDDCRTWPVVIMAFSSDGARLATVKRQNENDKAGAVQLWNLTTRPPSLESSNVLERLPAVVALAFSPNGQQLAIAQSYYLWLCDIPIQASCDPTLPPSKHSFYLSDPHSTNRQTHDQYIVAIAFSPDGRWLATGSIDSMVKLWDLHAPGYMTHPLVLHGHAATINAMAFSATNDWLATASSDHTVRLWNMLDLIIPPVILRGHEGAINSVAISSNSRYLATTSDDMTARLWTVPNAPLDPIVFQGTAPIQQITMSPQRHWLASGSTDGKVNLWPLPSANIPDTFPPPASMMLSNEPNIRGLAFSPDEHWLAVASWGTSVQLWNLSKPPPQTQPRLLTLSSKSTRGLTFSPNNRWLVTGSESYDGSIQLWDLQTDLNHTTAIGAQPGGVTIATFSPRGNWLATAGWNGTSMLWHMTDTGPIEHPIILHSDNAVRNIAFSPDEHWLATPDDSGTIVLWDLTATDPSSRAIQYVLDPGAFAVAFSPNGHWLAVAFTDAKVALIDLTDLKATPVTLLGHQGRVLGVAFSPDSQWLASSSEDHTICLWSLSEATTTPVILRGHTSGITDYAVIFSLDGHWLATGSSDSTVRLWRIQIDDLIKVACRTAGRTLTKQEWQLTMGNEAYHDPCQE